MKMASNIMASNILIENNFSSDKKLDNYQILKQQINESWKRIAPCWPLKNIIAVNPIAGFEDLAFKEALHEASTYFQNKDMPSKMEIINAETIKWLQAFFDQGQASIKIPNKQFGLLGCILPLIKLDQRIHNNDNNKINWINGLSSKSELIILESLIYLGIPHEDHQRFLTLMLTTLSGWAAYIKYKSSWSDDDQNKIIETEYLALRVVITALMWNEARELISWHNNINNYQKIDNQYDEISNNEKIYQQELITKINSNSSSEGIKKYDAQFIFCIDVRSESFRKYIEASGNYETFGFAGFFGLPIKINDSHKGDSYASCPVLLKPQYDVNINQCISDNKSHKNTSKIATLKKIYQSLKYNFITPLSLVELIGLFTGLWMIIKNLSPKLSSKLKHNIKEFLVSEKLQKFDIENIPIEKQIEMGVSALKMIGLTNNFSKFVFLCGHGSTTENNIFASSLNCGACGGYQGAPNARVLAKILNNQLVRRKIAKFGINIPNDTIFLGAKHNTTTDDLDIYVDDFSNFDSKNLLKIREDLKLAQLNNAKKRIEQLGFKHNKEQSVNYVKKLSKDWSEIRPEWGLARNASFIIAPRALTKNIDLENRAFLHSYQWQDDKDGNILKGILTAPVIVAQWINAQYLFSTLDNSAYGSGSKITCNITGKFGVMQGNLSDLMSGLPLQSVNIDDKKHYHILQRLTVVVLSPRDKIISIIKENDLLKKLFSNEWISLIAIDPQVNSQFKLNEKLIWEKFIQ